jgi:hypothetical protein
MSEREYRFYLDDIISFAEKVLAYTAGMNQESFEASGLNYDATVRNLELMGEAATHIPPAIREATRLSLAADHRHPQPTDSRLPRHRQRYPVEHYPG